MGNRDWFVFEELVVGSWIMGRNHISQQQLCIRSRMIWSNLNEMNKLAQEILQKSVDDTENLEKGIFVKAFTH